VAREAGVKRLILGHYSNRYNDETDLLNQAQEVFPETILGNEGMTIDLNNVLSCKY
jgi:ribonuclease Z